MNLSPNFTSIVESHEGFRPTMYKDSRNLPTIGFGTLIDSADLQYLTTATITKGEAEQLLLMHAGQVRFTLNNLIAHGLKINQNQFDALADFAYNVGINALLGSTLLKVMMEDPNNFERIKLEFLKWDKIVAMDEHGNREVQELPGLKGRRLDEFNLYSKPQNDTQA